MILNRCCHWSLVGRRYLYIFDLDLDLLKGKIVIENSKDNFSIHDTKYQVFKLLKSNDQILMGVEIQVHLTSLLAG